MNIRWLKLVVLILALTNVIALTGASAVLADDNKSDKEPAKAAAKIKALYVTGGGWHDYKALEPLVIEGIGKFASITCEVRQGVETLAAPKFGEGYDVIIYNICISGEADKNKTPPEVIENAVKVTRAGKPTVMLHATMHSFADVPAWTEMCGQKSRRHDGFVSFKTEKVAADDPILKTFPDDWKTPGDELYWTLNFPETSKALLKSKSKQSGKEHTVCWTSQYGKGRVFGCTFGHDAMTASDADYQRLIANGLLWACDKLGADGQPVAGYAGTGEKADATKESKKEKAGK